MLQFWDWLTPVMKSSYLSLITELKSKISVSAFSHITGGGIIGNTKRVIPEGLTINIDWKSWEIPAVFRLIQNTGRISDEEMRKAFNLGIGLISLVKEDDLDAVKQIASSLNEEYYIMGQVE